MIKPRVFVSLLDDTNVIDIDALTKIDPGHKHMSVITVFGLDVAKADHVELLLASSARGIDGKEDWERDTTTDEAHGGSNLEIAEKEVTIQRVVIEHIAIRYLEEGSNPIKHSTWQSRRAFPTTQAHQQLRKEQDLVRCHTYCSRNAPR